ncbi:hypothetical protein [Jeotgalibacillus marinus]|uniref:Uncharacterized protein n=1 Tax=Jeotgalibacillus marinus TaxID=86667 RepID=A0ABV3Q5H7_9BACL
MENVNTLEEVLMRLDNREKKMLKNILDLEKAALDRNSQKRVQIKKEIYDVIKMGVKSE